MPPITFTTSRDVPADTEVFAVPVFSDGRQPSGASGGVELDARYLSSTGFEGKPGQTQSVLADDGSIIVVVGLGDEANVDLDGLRRAAGCVVRAATRAKRVATTLLDAAPASLDKAKAAQAIAEGAQMAAYQFTTYKSESKPVAVQSLAVVGRVGAAVDRGLARGATVAKAVCLARDWINEPAGAMTPRRLEALARDIAKEGGLAITVLDEKAIIKERLGGLAGVAAGSDEPPRLIELVYNPPGAKATVAIVGKGITFDSGGLSLKSGDGMMTMKSDMSGAAAVIATMSTLKELAPKVKVIGLAACTENMPSGKATKPGDVLKIRNGKTVEVLNTDAEGRLVLADALSLATEQKPDAIIDLATLTGACVVALGREIAGLMGNDDDLSEQVRTAGDRAGEMLWPLPLPDRYRKHIDSPIADIKNIGATGQAGTLSAGLFLKEFVGDRPWVHLDIAGPAMAEADDGYQSKGGTGFGVRTLVELLTTYKKPARRKP
jgi:leucyl aminopeptidase